MRLHRYTPFLLLASGSLTGCITEIDSSPPPSDTRDLGDTGTAIVRTAAGITKVKYERAGDYYTIMGDILVRADELAASTIDPELLDEVLAEDPADGVQTRAAVHSIGSYRWPGARVPYVFDDDLSTPLRQATTEAMDHWEAHTPFRFEQRNGEADYVVIKPFAGNVCKAEVGRQGGAQTVELSTGCGKAQIIHELGHTVGFYHEQSRLDRDQYVTIHWENISDGNDDQFWTYYQRGRDGADAEAYDYASVMHYSRYAFSKNGEPTIDSKPVGIALGNDELSRGDIDAAIRLASPGGTVDDGNPKATLYRNASYGGISQSFLPGLYTATPYDQLNVIGDNQASSIAIPPTLAVRLCQDVTPGATTCQWFTRSTSPLPLPYNDKASYVRVVRAAAVYGDAELAGDRQTLRIGTYFASQGDLDEVGDNRITSMNIPPGLLVELCRSENGTGTDCQTFDDKVNYVGDFMNNQASLVRVKPAVTVFQDAYFGARVTVGLGVHTGAELTPAAGISAMKIDPQLKVTACDHEDGTGPCAVFRGDVTAVGPTLNDDISYLKVEYNTSP